MKQVRVALVGVGNVGKAFLQLMVEKEALLAEKYGLELVLTGPQTLRAAWSIGGHRPGGHCWPTSRAGKGVASFPGAAPG